MENNSTISIVCLLAYVLVSLPAQCKEKVDYKNKKYVSFGEGQANKSTLGNKKHWAHEDPSPGKVIISQTAFTQPKGTFNFYFSTFVDFLFPPFVYNFFDASYGIMENLEIRVGTYIPISYVGLGIYPKFSIPLGKYIRIGYMIDFAVYKRYVIDGDCKTEENVNLCQAELVYGGAPIIITIGSRNYYINLSLHIINHRSYTADCLLDPDHDICDKYLHNFISVISTIGASVRISKMLKLNFEIWYVNTHDITDLSEPQGHDIWPRLSNPMLKLTGDSVS